MKALATFASDYGPSFHRIEALAEVDGTMKVIDMQQSAVRSEVLHGTWTPADLHRSNFSVEYEPTSHPSGSTLHRSS
jgi:hypothetical protein